MAKKFEIQKQSFPSSVSEAYNSLLGVKSDNQYVNISLSLLDEIEEQPFPINKDKVDQIADSIEAVGVIEPIIVIKNGERYSILSGRHRFRACRQLGKDEIPCYIKDADDTTARYILIATNTDRNNEYSPIVYARAYAEQLELLKKLGKKSTVSAIAEQNGMSRKQIYRYIRLTSLIPKIQKWVDNNIISIEAAVELSFLSDNKQIALFDHIISLGIADSVIARHFKVTKTKDIHNVAENMTDEEFAAEIDNIIFSSPDFVQPQTKPSTPVSIEEPIDSDDEIDTEYQKQDETVGPSEKETDVTDVTDVPSVPAKSKKAKMGLEVPKNKPEFKDKDHEKNYNDIISMMKLTYNDTERMALAYLFALDNVCFAHLHDLYDFADRRIISKGLDAAWQTGTSRKTTRLAFNLFNGWCTDGETYTGSDGYEEDLPSCYFSPVNLFCCEYAPYYWRAIQIRFPEYSRENDAITV